MAFVPRTEAPETTNSNWIHTSYGGKNQCIHISGGSVIPNCVGYAWGRFMEILGTTPSLSCGNAEKWYGNTGDGYQRGQSPQVGAVVCWRKGIVGNDPNVSGTDAGHVAIVEKIEPDGSIWTSESGYKSFRFKYRHRANDGNWESSSPYVFQGFIYNPAVGGAAAGYGMGYAVKDNLSYFIEAASSKLSSSDISNWLLNVVTNLSPSLRSLWNSIDDHSLRFVLGCASDVDGLLDVVIPCKSSRNGLVETALDSKMGSWLSGPAHGIARTPHPGDIIYVRTHPLDKSYKQYDCDRIGIVVTIKAEHKFDYVYADRTGVHSQELEFDSCFIAGYYRPKWSLVESNVLNQIGISLSLGVYDEISGRDDAAVREVAYLNTNLEPSILPSNMKLSVINYTSGISALFLAWGGSSANVTYSSLILDGFTSVQCAIVEQLMSYGLNAAVAIGILANIKHESSFNPAAKGDYQKGVPTSFGLCQWHYGRGNAMKSHCLSHGGFWETNVTGQISYLWYELTETSEKSIVPYLEQCPCTLAGAQDAAEIWCRKFERPRDPDGQSGTRRKSAETFWNDAIPQLGVQT